MMRREKQTSDDIAHLERTRNVEMAEELRKLREANAYLESQATTLKNLNEALAVCR